jgi:hypothetical protein
VEQSADQPDCNQAVDDLEAAVLELLAAIDAYQW